VEIGGDDVCPGGELRDDCRGDSDVGDRGEDPAVDGERIGAPLVGDQTELRPAVADLVEVEIEEVGGRWARKGTGGHRVEQRSAGVVVGPISARSRRARDGHATASFRATSADGRRGTTDAVDQS
jgi:hypothetical protein